MINSRTNHRNPKSTRGPRCFHFLRVTSWWYTTKFTDIFDEGHEKSLQTAVRSMQGVAVLDRCFGDELELGLLCEIEGLFPSTRYVRSL